VEAVVMAAGEGTRLRPLTERYAKPVLPVDGRPVVVTLLHELRAAGIERVAVVTGHLGSQVEALLRGFPLELRLVRQPEPLGSADAVRRAEAVPPYLVAAADTVFAPGDVGRFAAAGGDACGGAIAWRLQPAPGPGRAALGIADGRVVRVVDDDPSNPRAAAPLWLVGAAVHERLAGVPGPPFELADAFQAAIDAGRIIRAVEIGPTRDLTRPLDLIEHNFPYTRGL
jgi:UDP-N-acetylglucosamine diphosphorylase / glucose-1-phosphate thymidylyltransferase / UDP-N-acetylgalactosamine diphosphorylase / glucosamine-1-phosphate N-acetyltransferase / galactosamine-1-phosphate N-acetyltransferase